MRGRDQPDETSSSAGVPAPLSSLNGCGCGPRLDGDDFPPVFAPTYGARIRYGSRQVRGGGGARRRCWRRKLSGRGDGGVVDVGCALLGRAGARLGRVVVAGWRWGSEPSACWRRRGETGGGSRRGRPGRTSRRRRWREASVLRGSRRKLARRLGSARGTATTAPAPAVRPRTTVSAPGWSAACRRHEACCVPRTSGNFPLDALDVRPSSGGELMLGVVKPGEVERRGDGPPVGRVWVLGVQGTPLAVAALDSAGYVRKGVLGVVRDVVRRRRGCRGGNGVAHVGFGLGPLPSRGLARREVEEGGGGWWNRG